MLCVIQWGLSERNKNGGRHKMFGKYSETKWPLNRQALKFVILNLLKTTGYLTGLKFNKYTLCPHCVYGFCIYLRTNSDLCHLQNKLIGFYNREEKCLQHGTDWVFK
jgi:hypothetical protein